MGHAIINLYKRHSALVKNVLRGTSTVEGLYLPRGRGGRALTSLMVAINNERDNLRKYFLARQSYLHKRIAVCDILP